MDISENDMPHDNVDEALIPFRYLISQIETEQALGEMAGVVLLKFFKIILDRHSVLKHGEQIQSAKVPDSDAEDLEPE